jgi:hypothetical protein
MTDDKQRYFISAAPGYWLLEPVRSHAPDGAFKVIASRSSGGNCGPEWTAQTPTISLIRSRSFGARAENPPLQSSSPTAWFASPTGRASPARRNGLRTRRIKRAPERKPERRAPIQNSSRRGAPFNELLAAMASAGARGCAEVLKPHHAGSRIDLSTFRR